VQRDEDVRTACFLSLDVLRAQFGEELPYAGGLDRGFAFRGLPRVPFLNYQKGIHRARVQRGPAALSIQTSARSPYGDEQTDDGFFYAYRAGAADQPDNRALRAAAELAVPLVYFVATKPGVYRAVYPCYVVEDRPEEQGVLVAPGRWVGPVDEREPVAIDEPLARRYAVREVRVRLHQARFRALVLPAYRERCTVCRLRETRLLDAAHIARDVDPRGAPVITNGLSLCSIHHRAYDEDLVGISPDYRVHVAARLLDDEDGPMLDLLKGCEGTAIELPHRSAWQPDRELLADRFERFRAA
jgi:putative restriction endonuclease